MGPDVFISHAPLDQAVAEKVCAFLEAQDIRCWMAPRDLPPGQDAAESIRQGILACPIMVLIFSGQANDSEPVRREVEQAVQAQKVLIPFRIEDVPATGEMETYFRRRYWHDAHTPPLEPHLEELIRTIRPLTQKAAVNTGDESSILRTLPSRSSILRRVGGAAPSAAREPEGPLRVSLDFHRVVVAGHPSSLQFCVANCGAAPMESVEVTLESRNLRRALSETLVDLAPGQEQRGRLEIEPLRSGGAPLQVTIKARVGAREIAFLGSRSFRVNEVPATSDEMRNLLGNSNRPEDATSPVAPLAAAENIRSWHDLLKVELPECFEPLELDGDYEVGVEARERAGAARALHIPEAFLGQARAGAVLILEPMGTPTATPHQGIRLVARASFGVGRAREEADFLVRFWPRNEIHDTKTRRISKKHCTLLAQKGRIHVCNTAAASLVAFDDQDVTGPEGVLLEHRGILNLSGIYFLEVTRFPSACPQGPGISNLRAWAGMAAGLAATAPAGDGSVRFVAMNPHVLPQNSTWLLTDATFGTSRANPVVLDLEPLAEIQGRFYHYLGNFWIENLVANGGVQINGTVLEPGCIAPLAGGLTLKLGPQSFHLQMAA